MVASVKIDVAELVPRLEDDEDQRWPTRAVTIVQAEDAVGRP
jgi:hypothetical protein